MSARMGFGTGFGHRCVALGSRCWSWSGWCSIGSGAAIAANGSVKIIEASNRYAFSPKTQFANVGGSVTEADTSDAAHTVTSDSAGVITSPTIQPGKKLSMTFNAAGTLLASSIRLWARPDLACLPSMGRPEQFRA